jgi:hypothetical protein
LIHLLRMDALLRRQTRWNLWDSTRITRSACSFLLLSDLGGGQNERKFRSTELLFVVLLLGVGVCCLDGNFQRFGRCGFVILFFVCWYYLFPALLAFRVPLRHCKCNSWRAMESWLGHNGFNGSVIRLRIKDSHDSRIACPGLALFIVMLRQPTHMRSLLAPPWAHLPTPPSSSPWRTNHPAPSFSASTALPMHLRPRWVAFCYSLPNNAGTLNDFPQNTNVVKLFALLDKDDQRRQLCYYQAGIGTYTNPGKDNAPFTCTSLTTAHRHHVPHRQMVCNDS